MATMHHQRFCGLAWWSRGWNYGPVWWCGLKGLLECFILQVYLMQDSVPVHKMHCSICLKCSLFMIWGGSQPSFLILKCLTMLWFIFHLSVTSRALLKLLFLTRCQSVWWTTWHQEPFATTTIFFFFMQFPPSWGNQPLEWPTYFGIKCCCVK